MPGPIVPLGLMSKTSKVGKALASAAKPVTDSLTTSESLLSKRIEAIERLGNLQFIINGYIVTGEGDEHVEDVFDEMKKFYLQSRSFFGRKVSYLLSKYMKICRDAYLGKTKVNERELEKIMEQLEFELRSQREPVARAGLAAAGAVQAGAACGACGDRAGRFLLQEGFAAVVGVENNDSRGAA